MTKAAFIAGDWGTSRLRLYLCGRDGQVLDRRDGEGAAAGDHAARFAAAVADWDRDHGRLPAVLGGMVGSTIGWRDVPYLDCPARPETIAGGALRFDADGRAIAIIPGLRCTNPAGAPDVMRGEETQLLGALRRDPALARGRQVFCMPGTHAKWVAVEDGAVVHFQTALSGELFELLRKHSVLARGTGPVDAASPAFAQGLAAMAAADCDLLHMVFSTRARQVTGAMAAADAGSYLSGLIVAADVGGARSLFGLSGTVHLICTPELAALYGRALAQYGLAAAAIDGDAAALAGLTYVHAELTP